MGTAEYRPKRNEAGAAETPSQDNSTLPPGPRAGVGIESDARFAEGGLPTVPGYEILSVLGRGGMGIVYKAFQPELKRQVAVKMILHGSHASERELARRFRVEAEAVARLQHPNIIQIHDIGRCGDHPYFTLEFANGGSLADKLKGVPVSGQRAAEVVETLARAVHYAHENGIVHRDLKPANILLQIAERRLQTEILKDDEPGQSLAFDLRSAILKISDFGLAKRLDDGSELSSKGAVVGTPSYMAPEQAAGKTVTPAADTYALGAILYELLTAPPAVSGGDADGYCVASAKR